MVRATADVLLEAARPSPGWRDRVLNGRGSSMHGTDDRRGAPAHAGSFDAEALKVTISDPCNGRLAGQGIRIRQVLDRWR
jgi:hypothetical protein